VEEIMAQISCPECGLTLHYLEDHCRGPLSCPGCGNDLGQPGGSPTSVAPRSAPIVSAPPPVAPRPADPVEPRPLRPSTIDLSEPCVVAHAIRALLAGALAVVVLAILSPNLLGKPGRLDVVLALLGWLFAAGCARAIHALFWARPHFRISAEGLDVRYWLPVGRLLGKFRPWLRLVERRVRWSQLTGCRTYQHSTNGRIDWKVLLLDTPNGTVEVSKGIFATDIDDLQQAVLNYHEREVRRPRRRALLAAEDQGPQVPPTVAPAGPARWSSPGLPEAQPSGLTGPAHRAEAPITPLEACWVGRQHRALIPTLAVALGVVLTGTVIGALVVQQLATCGALLALILGAFLAANVLAVKNGAVSGTWSGSAPTGWRWGAGQTGWN
jgi:hypothetical protein